MSDYCDNLETRCPVCHGEGELSAEEKRAVEDTRAQLTTQSAALTQALERAERAERENAAWRALALWSDHPVHTPTAKWRSLGHPISVNQAVPSASYTWIWTATCKQEGLQETGRGNSPQECAIDLATKLGILDSASQVKP